MSSLFAQPTQHTPHLPPPPPAPTDTSQAQASADAQRKAARAAAGRQSTILTGGLGDYSMAPTKQRTLLGGG